MNNLKTIFSIILLLIFGLSNAQITSSSVTGKVVSDELTISGAKIILIHLPTNTKYESVIVIIILKSTSLSYNNVNVVTISFNER